jgi:hypothetical protein
MTAVPQHMQALAHGNKIRLDRAALKRQVQAGEVTAAEVIDRLPFESLTMSVYDLLVSQHRWGRSRALRLLAAAGVREGRKVGDLTPRQAKVITGLLERSWQ